jgi:hypothetical protein
MQFYDVTDNGGSVITSYILYADDGDLSAENWSPVGSYNGKDLTFILDQSTETTFSTGTKYRFRISAVNDIGEGEPSNSVRIALAELPDEPDAPMIDITKSTKTSLYVYWNAVTGGSISVDGYLLYMSEKGEG